MKKQIPSPRWQLFKSHIQVLWHSIPWLFHRRVILIPGEIYTLRIEWRQQERNFQLAESDFLPAARILHYETPKEFGLRLDDDTPIDIPRWAFDEVRRLITGKALEVKK